MTDTGQIPAEGLPENAGNGTVSGPAQGHGTRQQDDRPPGSHPHLAPSGPQAEYDDQLLMPRAQGAWGETPPPEPQQPEQGRPAAPRRPLHLGPQVPDPSASPVRSLADRGPAGAPVPQAPGPEADFAAQQADPALAGPQLAAGPHGGTPWAAPPGPDPAFAYAAEPAAQQGGPTGEFHPGQPPLPDAPAYPDPSYGYEQTPEAAQQYGTGPASGQHYLPENAAEMGYPPDAAPGYAPGPEGGYPQEGGVEYAPEGGGGFPQTAPGYPAEPLSSGPVPGPATGEGPLPVGYPGAEPYPDGFAAGGEPGAYGAEPLGQFVPVEGSVPTTPHLAPTPPHPLTIPDQDPEPVPEPGYVDEQHPPAEAVADAIAQAQDAPEHPEAPLAPQQPEQDHTPAPVPMVFAPEPHEEPGGPDGFPPEAPEVAAPTEEPAPHGEPAAPPQAQDAVQDPADTPAPDAPPATATVPAPRDGEQPESASPTPPPFAVPTVAAHPDEQQAPDAEPGERGAPAPGYADAERDAVLRVMRERRDIRNGFRPDPIPDDVLLRVLEAAHTAPSVGHSQPWDFVVIRSADTRRTMHELAMRQREAYAKSLPKGRAKQFKELKVEAILDTPVNIVVTADPTRGGQHVLGRHTQPQMAPYSSALAVENFWLAARAEGLGVGWVSFFDEREMVRALGLPEHLDVVAYLCVGYVDEFPDEPELAQAGWSKRRPLSWVVHEETYGRRVLPGSEPHDLLAETVAGIRPLDAKALGEAWERQKRMTKPAGALGMLEIISAQLSGLSRMCPPPVPEPAAVAVFAADHGVHAQGVTPWPQEVTAQMVANFLGGGAVCNAFATQVGAEICVVDVGVATELPPSPGLVPRRVRAGTADMTQGPALTREEVKAAVEVGIETARDLVAAGNKALLTGEMGIANTTASAALIAVFTGSEPAEVTGRGTGINDETLSRKTDVVRRTLELHKPDPSDPIGVLAAIGGLEHAAIVGLLLGGASLRTPVVLDGVSAGAAALVAHAIAPEVLAACIAGHRSAEPGHPAALTKLGLRPLVDLDLRLGEGTGALLALPLIQSAARAMHDVATFDSAGVTEK
ncbi:nicotinate-nucleotide--dimethylbenzimidazole phosphoribosyltransferase [Streptomyces sp. NPDC050560]|uniref:nicotinate-nucleotide--dimethylbenzimidazole phosphoribosyltransferase n=1 Tax=Streptomyces sp. NPDC050560 TaxID=3365630 RepID=UPI0037BC1EAF